MSPRSRWVRVGVHGRGCEGACVDVGVVVCCVGACLDGGMDPGASAAAL